MIAVPPSRQQQQHQAVLQAAAEGNLEALQRYDPHIIRTAKCATGCTALHWAAGSHSHQHQQQQFGGNSSSSSGGAVSVCAYLVDDLHMSPDLRCTGKALGRTPLHYAARNGCLATAQYLVLQGRGADPHAKAKHGVTPFQLAVFQNQLELCRWLVNECRVNASQECNDFGCGAVHWLAICPHSTTTTATTNKNTNANSDLIPMAEWLLEQGCDFRSTQKQGHSALHKAAWKGHLPLVRWLHERLNVWDDTPDRAGNFAADLARMGQHEAVVEYLRQHCSRERAASCAVLHIPLTEASDASKVRQAYLARAKMLHPDRRRRQLPPQEEPCSTDNCIIISSSSSNTEDADFDSLQRAYHHLTVEEGRGTQHNPAHSLKLLLKYLPAYSNGDDNKDLDSETRPATDSKVEEREDLKYLNARLTAVLLEFGEKGVSVCNLAKKWSQVWGPEVPFPFGQTIGSRSGSMGLTDALRLQCADVLELRRDERTGLYRAHVKNAGRLQAALQSHGTVETDSATIPH